MIIQVSCENLSIEGNVKLSLPEYMTSIPNIFCGDFKNQKVIALGRENDNSDIIILTAEYVPRIIPASSSLVPSGKIVLDNSGDFICVQNEEYVRGYCVISSKYLIMKSIKFDVSMQI